MITEIFSLSSRNQKLVKMVFEQNFQFMSELERTLILGIFSEKCSLTIAPAILQCRKPASQ